MRVLKCVSFTPTCSYTFIFISWYLSLLSDKYSVQELFPWFVSCSPHHCMQMHFVQPWLGFGLRLELGNRKTIASPLGEVKTSGLLLFGALRLMCLLVFWRQRHTGFLLWQLRVSSLQVKCEVTRNTTLCLCTLVRKYGERLSWRNASLLRECACLHDCVLDLLCNKSFGALPFQEKQDLIAKGRLVLDTYKREKLCSAL